MTSSNLKPTHSKFDERELAEDIEIADAIESCESSYSMAPDTSIRIVKEQYSVYEVIRHVCRSRIDLQPNFQRYNVWTLLQKSELIESILMGIPIPMIYLFENEEGLRQVIDGKQRLTTLKDFVNGDFALMHLKMLSQYNDFRFYDLPPILQSKIEDTQLQVYIVQPPTPDVVKYYIFERINRGGTQLNQQEMRHALHQGKSTELLQTLATDERFLMFGIAKSDSSRMQREYMILRSLAFFLCSYGLIETNLCHDINDLHSVTMKMLNSFEDAQISNLQNAFVWSLYRILQVIGTKAFTFSTSNNRTIISLFEIFPLVFNNIDVEKKIETVNPVIIENIVEDFKLKIREDKTAWNDYKSLEGLSRRMVIANQIIKEIKKC